MHVANRKPKVCTYRYYGCIDYFVRNMLDLINYDFSFQNCLKEEKYTFVMRNNRV